MTPDDFRRLALALPDTEEGAHMGHVDFRVGGKIFATLGYPDAAWGMARLPPEQQELFVAADPEAFRPVKGAWGRQGATNVRLEAVDETNLDRALRAAWLARAPRPIAERHGAPSA